MNASGSVISKRKEALRQIAFAMPTKTLAEQADTLRCLSILGVTAEELEQARRDADQLNG